MSNSSATTKPQEQKTQTIVGKQRASQKLSSEAIKKLELEYFKKRRALEKEERKALREEHTTHIAEGKKIIKTLRKQYAMTDEQIAKRLGITTRN
jgi:DNA-binding transcriptional regulator YiaG